MRIIRLLILFALLITTLLASSCDRDITGFLVSGLISVNGVPLAEVRIDFSGDTTGYTSSDAQGQWEALLKGSVRVTPSKDNYTFEPNYKDIEVNSEINDVDFIASPTPLYLLDINIYGSGAVDFCQQQYYPKDTVVEMTVIPDINWEFVGWFGEDAAHLIPVDQNTYQIIMDKDMEIIAEFKLITDPSGGGTTVFWERKAEGQLQTCGECTWYWPNNKDWSQSEVIGSCPCGGQEQAMLEPSNWTIEEYPDSGSHYVIISSGNEVLLDTFAEIHTLQNAGLLNTFTGRSLDISSGGLRNFGEINLAINSEFNIHNGLENSGSINLACGAGLSLKGLMDNSGTLVMEGPQARGTSLSLTGDIHLFGGGTISLTEAFFVRIDSLNGHRLVNEDNLIHGAGVIGFNDLALTNRGTITADIFNEVLAIRPSGDRSPSINDGLMNSVEGGILQLSGFRDGNLDNSGGIIRAEDESHVELERGLTIRGGLLESVGSGRFFTKLDALAGIEDLTFQGLFEVGHGTTLNLGGSIENQGLIDVPAQTGRGTFLSLARDTTLSGGGVIRLGEEFFGRIDSEEGYLLTNQDNLILGCGEIGWNDLIILNQGQITADTEGKILTIRPGASASSINENLFSASEGGILKLSGKLQGVIDNTAGTIKAEENSHVLLAEGIIISGGLLSTAANGRFYTHLNPQASLADLTFQGFFEVGNGGIIGLAGTINNQGLIEIKVLGGQSSHLELVEDTILTGGGIINLENEFSARITGKEEGLQLTILDQIITGEGRLGYDTLILINEGEIEAANNEKKMRIAPLAETAFINRGILRAKPGAILSIEGNFQQENNGKIELNIGYLESEIVSGQLRVSDVSDLSGTLIINLTDGFMPEIGAEFHILDLNFNEIVNEFDIITLPPLTEGTWDDSQLLTAGIIKVVD